MRASPPAGGDARIVSLVPSITELLFYLGLGDQVVGRTTFCIHPETRVAGVPRVGGTKKPHMEKLRQLRPSHVIVNVDENRKEDVEAITAFTPHVVVTHPLAPDDNLTLYRMMGGIFDRRAQAEQLCGEFQRARDALVKTSASLPPRRVLYLIWRDPWMSVSADTYVANMLRLGGMAVVAARAGDRYPVIAEDEPAWQRADAVLLSSEPYPFREKHLEEVQAGTGKTVRLVDGELLSWYGSRAIAGVRYARQLGRELRA